MQRGIRLFTQNAEGTEKGNLLAFIAPPPHLLLPALRQKKVLYVLLERVLHAYMPHSPFFLPLALRGGAPGLESISPQWQGQPCSQTARMFLDFEKVGRACL